MLYSIYHKSNKTSMENFEIDNSEYSQKRNIAFLDSGSAKGRRLETATEISSNDYDEDGVESNCRRIELASPMQAPQLNDIQEKLRTENTKSNQLQNPHQVVRKGYLERETTSILNRWQINYCVLTLSKLYFFEDENRINLVSCINFNNLTSSLTRNELTFTLQVQQFENPIKFKTFTERQAHFWEQEIGSIIMYNINSCKINFMQSKKSLYQQKDAITEKQFLESAQTGDIVLMSTTDTQCAIQRFVTNSEYDHIGLVVNFHGEIKIFQSNADEGVNIYSWSQFQAVFHHYQKIAIRKLHYHKKTEMHPLLMNFIKSSIGKKYDFGTLKLMRKTSGDDNEKERGYFCSQLVAKVYKNFGLLQRQKASSSYWPVDFTSRGGLNLFDSAFLGEERLIILNKHVRYHS